MLKRLFDIFVAATAIVILSPVLMFLSFLIAKKLGRPVLFIQQRPGINGRVFKLLKFRSMTDGRDADGNLFTDSVRLTEFGKKLRSTSLDELPGLWNVLQGDMSLVGPRPLLVE